MCEMKTCPVCQRKVREHDMTKHHYNPQCFGGNHNEVIEMCRTCHEVLHFVIPIEEVELYSTIDLLETHWAYAKFLEWIRAKNGYGMYKIKKITKEWLSFEDMKRLKYERKYASLAC